MNIYLLKKMDFNSFKLNSMIFNSWKINMQNMWFVSICNNNQVGFNFQQISIKISLFFLLDLLQIILWWTSIVGMVYKFLYVFGKKKLVNHHTNIIRHFIYQKIHVKIWSFKIWNGVLRIKMNFKLEIFVQGKLQCIYFLHASFDVVIFF